jgi:hypothetical protein
MSDFQGTLNKTIQAFIKQVTTIANRAAIATLESAFNPQGAGSNSLGRRGTKRTATELAVVSERVASFIQAHPGLRIEQINKQLGTDTKDLALPLRKLIAKGVIRIRGRNRSTTYFASTNVVRAA